jgi:hypothetical protein
LSEFFVFTSFQKKKATGIAKKNAAEGKNFCFPGLTTAMLGLTTAAFYLETGKKCRLSGTNCPRGIRSSILPQTAAAVKRPL